MKAITVQFRRNFDDFQGRYCESEPMAHSVFYEHPHPLDEVAEWMLYMLEEHYPTVRFRSCSREYKELRDDEHVGDEVYFRFRTPEGRWYHYVMSTSCYGKDLSKTVYVKELDRPPFWVQEEPKVLRDFEYKQPVAEQH